MHPSRPPGLGDPEHGGHHNIPDQVVHQAGERHHAPDRPLLDAAPGRIDDRLFVSLERLAVEGSGQLAAQPGVLLAVQGRDRVMPEHRLMRREPA